MKDVLLIPHTSEKTYAMSQAEGIKTYVFNVPKGSTKQSVAQAVTSQFEVTVTAVKMLNQRGKAKVSYRKRSRGLTGKRSDVKKAYVTLKSGDSLTVFAAIDEAREEEAAQTAKAEKAAAKGKK